MASVARIGDIGVGTCCGHHDPTCIPMTGTIISGCTSVIAENSGVAKVGDIVVGSCGHTGTIVSGSTSVFAENGAVARIGDSFVGTFSGTIVSGAISVEVE